MAKTAKKKNVKKVKAVKKSRSASRAKAAKSPARRSAAKPARAAKKTSKGFQLTSVAPSLTVNDVTESLAWYCDVLGFTIGQKWERDGVLVGAELRAGRTPIYIGGDDWKMGRDRVKGQGFRLYFYTDQNIDQIAAGIKARGGTLASEPKDEWGTRWFTLEDPTGYKITVSSNR